MIEVELPDGTVIEFPAGTPQDVMMQAIRGMQQPQEQPPAGVRERVSAALERGEEGIDPARRARQEAIDARAMADIAGPEQAPEGLGIGQSFGAGVLRGVSGLTDFPGMVVSQGAALGARAAGAITGQEPQTAEAAQMAGRVPFIPGQGFGTGDQSRQAMAEATGGFSEQRGETMGERIAGTVGEFTPGAALFGGVSPGALGRYAVAPGVASELAGAATEGTAAEPAARAVAAIAAPYAAGGASTAVRRAVSPYGGRISPQRQQAISVLEQQGIDLTAGQRVGSEALRRSEGFSGAGADVFRRQNEQFTAAAMRTAGSTSPRATPEAMQQAASDIGRRFETALSGLEVRPSSALIERMRRVASEYAQQSPSAARVPRVDNIVDILRTARSNNIPVAGQDIASWRSALSQLSTSSDAATRTAAISAIRILDRTTSAALRASGRRDDIALLSQARDQWRNFLAIQSAASRAGAQAAEGILSPSALRSAVASQGRSAYAQGRRGDLGRLVRAGEMLMRQPATSGTAENIRALFGRGSTPSSVVGAAAGTALTGGPVGAALGAALGSQVPGATRAAFMTRPGQAYLGNQLMGLPPPTTGPGMVGPTINALRELQ